jgi:hypothetical protein
MEHDGSLYLFIIMGPFLGPYLFYIMGYFKGSYLYVIKGQD